MDAEFIFSFSLHPWNLLQLWSPYAFLVRVFHGIDIQPHELALYNGAFCTAAIAWLIVRRDGLGPRRRLALGLVGCAALFLLLALGKYGGLYWLVAQLPVIRVFRAPARYIAVLHLFMALAAAIAFDDLAALARGAVRARGQTLWPLAAIVALGAATLALPFVVSHDTELYRQLSSPSRISVGFVIVAMTILVMTLAARGVRWAPMLLLPILVSDIGAWGWAYAWRPAPVPLERFVSDIRVPRDGLPPFTLYEAASIPTADVPVLRGFRMYNGYVGMWPLRVVPLESIAAQRLGGVKWRHDVDGWHPVEEPMPRARLVGDVRVSADPARDVESIDIARTALVQQNLGPFQQGASDARIIEDRPGHLAIDVESDTRQLLVLTERFDAAWRATVDERPAGIVRAYGDQMAVVVDRGARRVDLRFSPASVRAGVAISVLGCVLLGAALLRAYSWGAAEG
jgi:hypothetical protein